MRDVLGNQANRHSHRCAAGNRKDMGKDSPGPNTCLLQGSIPCAHTSVATLIHGFVMIHVRCLFLD